VERVVFMGLPKTKAGYQAKLPSGQVRESKSEEACLFVEE